MTIDLQQSLVKVGPIIVWLKDSGWETVRSHPWLSLGTAVGVYVGWRFIRRPRNLPPGPVGIPGLGAVAWVREDMAKVLYDARPKYGDVICFYIGTKPHVFLNSYEAITEVLIGRGEEFAARPAEHDAVAESVGFISEFTLPYSEAWKARKKFAMSTLRSFGFGTPKSEGKMQEQLDRLEQVFMATGGAAIDPSVWFGPLAAGTITSILYGADYTWNDPEMKEVVQIMNDVSSTFDGIFTLQFVATALPLWCTKLACLITMRKTRRIFSNACRFMEEKLEEHRRTLDRSNLRDVMDAYLTEHQGEQVLSDELIAGSLLFLLPDSIDTTSKLMSWVILYVTSYPEVQKRLHDLLDEVCGSSRHPTLADRSRLAYADAIVLEVLRITNFLPMTPAKAALRDTTIRGYNIPRGTPIFGIVHSVHFDPLVHSDPTVFNPARFIDSDGKLVNAGKVMTFSVGPRSCIGVSLVKVELFLMVARVFHRFRLEFPQDEAAPSFVCKPFSAPAAFRVRALQR